MVSRNALAGTYLEGNEDFSLKVGCFDQSAIDDLCKDEEDEYNTESQDIDQDFISHSTPAHLQDPNSAKNHYDVKPS